MAVILICTAAGRAGAARRETRAIVGWRCELAGRATQAALNTSTLRLLKENVSARPIASGTERISRFKSVEGGQTLNILMPAASAAGQ